MTARRSHVRVALTVALVVVAATLPGAVTSAAGAAVTTTSAYLPAAHHVFVVNLENKGYDETWGPASTASYLSKTLRARGVLLNQYYGTAHNSLPNYIAQISGQGPNVDTQSDCQVYAPFVRLSTVAPGQAVGRGCVYPADVPTLTAQLTAHGLSWKGYMQDMGTPCRHPVLGAPDDTQQARVGDQYAARHNPFVYFRSITDSTACAARDVDLAGMTTDLTTVSTTPSLSYITPNLCDDGHDAKCVDGRTGGLVAADAWLKLWIPKITSSPAFKTDGILIITFDESDGPQSDSTACCGEQSPDANGTPAGGSGPGGGRVGTLVISRFVRPGTWSTTPYNHYSLLASLEDLFGLPKLGYAATPGLHRFGLDVYNAGV